jgi:hypothetical protein
MKVFVFIILMFVSGCQKSVEKVETLPDWFGKIEKKDFEIIGYGSGKTLEEAKENARKDISNQISLQVENRIERTSKNENGKFSKTFYEKSSQKSDVTLSDLEILKISKDGKFVALKFVNLPFEKKFLSKLQNWKCHQNSFFEKTSLGKFAISEKKCLPKLQIFKNGNSFFLTSDEVSQLLPNLNRLFFNFENRNITLTIPNEIQENNEFDIEVETAKNGFITILVVSEKGEVFEIVSNLKIPKNRKISLSKIKQQLFYGKIENGENLEQNLFIAIFSKESLNSRFLQIRSEKEKLKGFGFQKLPKILNSKDIEFEAKIQYLSKK